MASTHYKSHRTCLHSWRSLLQQPEWNQILDILCWPHNSCILQMITGFRATSFGHVGSFQRRTFPQYAQRPKTTTPVDNAFNHCRQHMTAHGSRRSAERIMRVLSVPQIATDFEHTARPPAPRTHTHPHTVVGCCRSRGCPTNKLPWLAQRRPSPESAGLSIGKRQLRAASCADSVLALQQSPLASPNGLSQPELRQHGGGMAPKDHHSATIIIPNMHTKRHQIHIPPIIHKHAHKGSQRTRKHGANKWQTRICKKERDRVGQDIKESQMGGKRSGVTEPPVPHRCRSAHHFRTNDPPQKTNRNSWMWCLLHTRRWQARFPDAGVAFDNGTREELPWADAPRRHTR